MASKTDMAILGMLTVEPMSGYDMKQFCEESISHFWHETFGNLYPRLKRLSDGGLIKGRREKRAHGPDAVVYSLTARGRGRFKKWMQQPPESEYVRSEFMLKVFFGVHASIEVNEQRLLDYQQEQKRIGHQYRVIEQSIRSDDDGQEAIVYWLMSLRRGQLLTESRERWARECLALLEELKSKGNAP